MESNPSYLSEDWPWPNQSTGNGGMRGTGTRSALSEYKSQEKLRKARWKYPLCLIENAKHKQKKFSARQGAPKLIRYADDFVVFHAQAAEVLKAQQLIATWLKGMGLELKPSKTRLCHTLNEYQGNVGFNFLGFSIRQYPVGRTHTGTTSNGKPLGFKTLIKPSKEGVQRHLQALKKILQRSQSFSQEKLIDQLNPVIYDWTL